MSEYNKISKYKEVTIETGKMWPLKTTIIVGALGMIKKGTDKHINKIPGNSSQYEKQIAFCRIAHLLKRVISM